MALTCNFSTRAGSGTITLERTGGTFAATTFEVSDISDLGIDFTLEEDTDNATNVLLSPSKFKFTVFDQLGNGDSLFKKLDAIPTYEAIKVTFDFTTDSGYSWTDIFEFSKEDVEFNYADRNLDIKSFNVVDSTVTVDTIFSNYSEDILDLTQEAATGVTVKKHIMEGGDFVKNFFKEVYSGTSVDVRSNIFDASVTTDGTRFFAVARNGSVAFGNYGTSGYEFSRIEDDAATVVQQMAAMDGSVVGSILGQSFFVGRTDTSQTPVSLSTDDLLSLEVGLSVKEYRSVTMFFKGYAIGPSPIVKPWLAYGNVVGSSDGMSDRGYKSLYINFNPNFLRLVAYDFNNSIYKDDGYNGVTDSDFNTGGFYENAGTDLRKDQEEGDRDITIKDFNAMESDATAGRLFTFRGDDSMAYSYNDHNENIVRLNQRLQKSFDKNSDVNFYSSHTGNFTGSGFPFDLSSVADSYAYAYGAKGSRDIEIEVIDIDKVKPQDAIRLDSSFSDYLGNSDYRPHKIKYDILNDIIKIEAYIINV